MFSTPQPRPFLPESERRVANERSELPGFRPRWARPTSRAVSAGLDSSGHSASNSVCSGLAFRTTASSLCRGPSAMSCRRRASSVPTYTRHRMKHCHRREEIGARVGQAPPRQPTQIRHRRIGEQHVAERLEHTSIAFLARRGLRSIWSVDDSFTCCIVVATNDDLTKLLWRACVPLPAWRGHTGTRRPTPTVLVTPVNWATLYHGFDIP